MKSATEDRGQDVFGASTPAVSSADDDATMAELRSLLLGPAEQQLAEVRERLADPQRQLQEVSRVLPAAVAVRTREDDELTEALAPTVAQAIERSVRRNPQPLVDAIFPVMGPAIRRAIASALSGMTQSLNRTLAHSFSVQGLKWRVEAWRTGRSFGEVVLLHTLLYRVEQVFLIHRETGLLLQHVVAPGAESQDADMVSAMLTAIQDFMRDSFKTPEGAQLEDVKIGERSLWVEQGPQAHLAGVVRGEAPRELRVFFQETLERIHFQFGDALRDFSGDAATFAAARHLLEDCLQTELDPRKRGAAPGRRLTPLITAGALLLASVLVAVFFIARGAWRWNSYLQRLRAEPGIVITEADSPLLFGKYQVQGLRDPQARDPLTLLSQSRVAPEAVVSRWQPYQSMSPEFVLARAERLLSPPPTVRLTLDRGVLTATGFAPVQWAAEAQRTARFVAGVEQFRDDQLFDLQRLEHPLLKFELDRVQLLPGQEEQLQQLTVDISRLLELARVTGKRVRIEITGRTDGSGTEERNDTLSRERAEAVAAALSATLPPAPDLIIVPVGTKDKLREERSEDDRASNRSVTLRATLLDPQ
jgi:outer membrane protein OmpA-like peptidoglycan-associated protein